LATELRFASLRQRLGSVSRAALPLVIKEFIG
jgi:hypothetical protein